jgi:hypothetical protein
MTTYIAELVLLLQPTFYLGQYLAKAWLIGWSHAVRWSNVLVMRMGYDLRMMRSVVIAKNVLAPANIGVGIMHADRIAQFSADDFIKVQVGTIPEQDPTADQAVIVIRSQASEGFLDLADLNILPQATFDGRKVVVNSHAAAGSCCIN